MHDTSLHEGLGWEDENEGGEDYYLEDDEPMYEDGDSIEIGSTNIVGECLCFWNGVMWEPIKLPDGTFFEVTNAEEERIARLAMQDPVTALIEAAQYDVRDYTRDDLVSALIQSEMENIELMSFLGQWSDLNLTPAQIECIIDELCSQIERNNNREQEVLALHARYDRLGTPEEILEALQLCHNMMQQHTSFKRLLEDMEGQDKTWGTLEKKGWKMVAMDPETFACVQQLKTVETIIEPEATFMYMEKGVGD